MAAEEALRGRAAKISGCLTLEFLRREPAMRVADDMGVRRPATRLVCIN